MLSVREVAAELGWDAREVRDRLHRLHEEHGGLLFRQSAARNAKLWVSREALERAWPAKFAPKPPTSDDIHTLLGQVRYAVERADEALEEVANLRRKVGRL